MTKRRVMIATPYFDKPNMEWVSGLVATLTGLDDAIYEPRVAKGCYVMQGRNHLMFEARKDGFDEVIFVDADMPFGAPHIKQLRRHDVDIVGAPYCKKIPGEPQPTFHAASLALTGDLIECNDAPTGLLRIRVKPVCDAIAAKFPWRAYQHKGDEEKFEFFPYGLVGEGTPEKQIENIRSILNSKNSTIFKIVAIENELATQYAPSQRQLLGEDVYFCRLARQAGLKVWVDTSIRLRHIGEIGYPAKEIDF